jgi:phosphoheptose isomerase
LQPSDVVIACSVHGGQGSSADLVRAVRFANESGASTISLVGFDGGKYAARPIEIDEEPRQWQRNRGHDRIV